MVKRYNIVSRIIAGAALVCVYMFSLVGTSGLFLAASTSSAEAQYRARGRGRSYARGYVRGSRGRGYGYRGVYVAPVVRGGCYFSRRWGRVVCY